MPKTWREFLARKRDSDRNDNITFYNNSQFVYKALSHYADYMGNDPAYGLNEETAIELDKCANAILRLQSFHPDETNPEEIRQAQEDLEQVGKLKDILKTECGNGYTVFQNIGRIYPPGYEDLGLVNKPMRNMLLGALMEMEDYYGFGNDYTTLMPMDDFEQDRVELEIPDIVYNEETGGSLNFDDYIMKSGRAELVEEIPAFPQENQKNVGDLIFPVDGGIRQGAGIGEGNQHEYVVGGGNQHEFVVGGGNQQENVIDEGNQQGIIIDEGIRPGIEIGDGIQQQAGAGNNADADYLLALQLQQEENEINLAGGAIPDGIGQVGQDIGNIIVQHEQNLQDEGVPAQQGRNLQSEGERKRVLDELVPEQQYGNRMDAQTRRMVMNVWQETDDDELHALNDMFKTRTRRLYGNSSEYKRANRALDAYIEGRRVLRQELIAIQEQYNLPENANVRDSNDRLRNRMLTALDSFRQLETELKNAMQHYVNKKTGGNEQEVGAKQVADMYHGYGAARLTAAKGLLDHLKSIRGQEIIRNDAERDLHSVETSFRKLFNDKYREIRTETDRRKRSADHALEEIKRRRREGRENQNHQNQNGQEPPVMG